MDAATGQQQMSLIFGIPESDGLLFNARQDGSQAAALSPTSSSIRCRQPAARCQLSVQSFSNRAQLSAQVFQTKRGICRRPRKFRSRSGLNMFKNDDNIAPAVIGARAARSTRRTNHASDFLQACRQTMLYWVMAQPIPAAHHADVVPRSGRRCRKARSAVLFSPSAIPVLDGSQPSGRIETTGNTAIARVSHNGGVEVLPILVALLSALSLA
ncbi:MAG: hypothetical protein H6880_05045 [Rhodobiaceae bacterium]|nr:hypothetical protein [Rhodobiaceae bacterium]